jgi:hypothetical protein
MRFRAKRSNLKMPKFNMNDEYRRSDEYKLMYSQIKSINPTLPHFLCEAVMIINNKQPLAYKHHRKTKGDTQSASTADYEIVGGSIVLEE